jgi:ABC-type phosphate/phosphonate transport system substrate-binding protein
MLCLGVLAVALLGAHAADPEVLNIGSSGSLSTGGDAAKEKASLESLQSFIKDETGFKNDIHTEKDWRVLVEKLGKGDPHLGVLQGYELAWARKDNPRLKPLAIAVNVHRYPVVTVVTHKNSKAADLEALKGQTVFMPATTPGILRLFVEKQAGKKLEDFFSKVIQKEDIEDGLDEVVDGNIQAAVLDGAALEAFMRRKPGRYKQLKEVAKSEPFPPVVVTYVEGVLSDGALQKFRDGMVNASKKEKGQTLLTLFRLSGFETMPPDFDKVLDETLKKYPPPDPKGK